MMNTWLRIAGLEFTEEKDKKKRMVSTYIFNNVLELLQIRVTTFQSFLERVFGDESFQISGHRSQMLL